MRYFLGIDGGQSSTICVVGDESGRVVATGRAGPCNHVKTGDGRARFVSAIEGCLRDAGFENTKFEAACLGLSGGPEDKDALAREIIQANHYFITHDAMIALAGATAGGPGIAVIAGTGSIAFGRNAEGRVARAGGWGYVFGDEGSAFDIVRQALRAILRHEEGWGPSTPLLHVFLEQTNATTANELLHRFYSDEFPREQIAALAPLVDTAASAGDPVAQEILSRAAQSLAAICGAVRAQLFHSSADVRYIGGVFQSALVLERFRMLVELSDARVSPPAHEPAHGALLEAYRIAMGK